MPAITAMSALLCIWSAGKFIAFGTIVEEDFLGNFYHYPGDNILFKNFISNSNSLVISGSELIQPSSAILFLKEVFQHSLKCTYGDSVLMLHLQSVIH